MSKREKTAIVLFNLGGPDTPEAVEPFLFNLFSDPAILGVPDIIRPMLARFISRRRTPVAQAIYAQIGNKSPIVEETQKQANALQERLSSGEGEYKTFICMRYWHPMTEEVVAQVKAYAPDTIILLPLYPQFSTTTTGSSFTAWEKAASEQELNIPTARIGCYPTHRHFIAAHAQAVRSVYFDASSHGIPRVLFSAHGLPEKIIAKGDPYQWQVERTAEQVVNLLGIPELDYQVCYQSRVGPLKWIGPSTEDEIRRAGAEGKSLIVVPIAFVSEHSETLVELDIEYKELAEEYGVPAYHRIPTLGVTEDYIETLAELCENTSTEGKTCSQDGGRLCPAEFTQCPCGV